MTRAHHCPHCRCLPDTYNGMGTVNKTAPFYRLVEYVDNLSLVHRQRDISELMSAGTQRGDGLPASRTVPMPDNLDGGA